MRVLIIALLAAISYAQTAEEAGGEVTTGVDTGTDTGSTTGETGTGETETGETGTGETETGETGTGETETGATTGETETGSTTGEIPSTGTTTGEVPSTGTTSTGATSTGSTGFPMPCKMRTMNNCAGRSPMGGRCYLSEFTECEEAEMGDGDFMCIGLGMSACAEKKLFCFWDPSEMECTENSELEFPMMPGGVPITLPQLPLIPGMTAPADSTGTAPVNPMATITACVKYTLTNLAACTMANGCYLDEEQCKPIAAKMAGIDAPEIERPEGMLPGMMPRLPGLPGAPLSKAQAPQEKQAQDTSNKNNIPHELIYGTAGFFGGILISVVIYFLTCGRPKHNSHRDVFLEEYSSRAFPVV